MRRSTFTTALIGLTAGALALAGPATADTTVRVDENNEAGWVFNPDPNNATDWEFSLDASSIGTGSLMAGPIGANAAEKFIAAKSVGLPVSDVTSISYDFQIAGNGTVSDANEFYLNVYANIDASDNFYDCRFDYSPSTGSTTAFTTAAFAATSTPKAVTKRGTRITACPTTLAGMPAGSYVRAFVLNVGDTSATDEGLAGYYDNVQVATPAGTTTYDFEVRPEVKDACKDGGYATYGFETQGDCVSALQANTNAGK